MEILRGVLCVLTTLLASVCSASDEQSMIERAAEEMLVYVTHAQQYYHSHNETKNSSPFKCSKRHVLPPSNIRG